MVDQEVEDTLREIRERVLAESAHALPAEPSASRPNGAASGVAESAQAAETDAVRASFGQLRSESDSERARLSELYARLAAAESRLDGALDQLRHSLAAGVEQLRADGRALAEGLRDEQRAQVQARASEIL